MGNTIAIVQRKGGVGKSTTTVNVAVALAQQEKKVLIVETDPQCNTSSALGITPLQPPTDENLAKPEYKYFPSMVEVIRKREFPAEQAILQTKYGVHLLPARKDMDGMEGELASRPQEIIRTKILPLKDYYDYILIDTPPRIGYFTNSALIAADYVLIVAMPDVFTLDALTDLTTIIPEVQAYSNHNLKVLGILPNKIIRRTNMSEVFLKTIKEYYGDFVIPYVINNAIAITTAQGEYMPIAYHNPKHEAVNEYNEVAKHIIKKIEVEYEQAKS